MNDPCFVYSSCFFNDILKEYQVFFSLFLEVNTLVPSSKKKTFEIVHVDVVAVVEVFRLAFGTERGSQEVLQRLSWPERPSCQCHFCIEAFGSLAGPRKC